jgi:hypothetical protein
MLRLGLCILYGVGVTLLSVPAFRKFSGAVCSSLVVANVADRLGANGILSVVVFMATFLAVWHFFDWRYKKSTPEGGKP